LQPYILAYQWPHLSAAIQADFKRALGAAYPPGALKALAERAGAKTDLKSIGFREEDIDEAAEIILSKPYANVAPVTKAGLVRLLHNAYYGKMD
jgi:maleylacetate reductase